MNGLGFGGNAQGSTGQMQIVAVAQQIPFPSNVGGAADSGGVAMKGGVFNIEGARRFIVATDDIYIGFSSAVTTATGFYVAAGTKHEITTRAAVWFAGVAKAGESSSSSLSSVPDIYSSSSLSPVPGIYSSSSGVPVDDGSGSSTISQVPSYRSSSSFVPVETDASSSSKVPVTTFGTLFWLEESN